MGKGRDKRKKKDTKIGKGAAKTEQKNQKREEKQRRRKNFDDGDLGLSDEDDIEIILAQWKKKEEAKSAVNVDENSSPPTVRVNASLTPNPVRDGELVLIGGEYWNGEKTFSYNDLYCYHIERETWRCVESPNSPPPRSSHQAVAYNKHIWIFGGEFTSPSQNQFYHYRDIWRLDCETMKWEEMKVKGGPTARSGHRMVLWRNNIVMFGGFFDTLASKTTQYYDDTWILSDLNTAPKWKKVEIKAGQENPPARSGCCMGVFSDTVYVYGGYSAEGAAGGAKGVTHTDMWAFNTQTLTWRKVKKTGIPPALRSGLSCIVDRRRMIFFGGVWDYENKGSDMKSMFFNDMYVFNMDNRRWFPLQLHGKKKVAVKKRRRKVGKEGDTATEVGESEIGESDIGDEEDIEEDVEEENENENKDDGEKEQEVPKGEEEGEGQQQPEARPAALEDPDAVPDLIPASEGGEKAEGSAPPPPASPTASGEVPGSPTTAAEAEEPKVQPSARIQAMMTNYNNTMYLFGGMSEEGSKEITYNDMYKLNLNTLDVWELVFDRTEYEWEGEEGDDGEGSSSSDDDEEDEGAKAGKGKKKKQRHIESDEDEEEEEEDDEEGAGEENQPEIGSAEWAESLLVTPAAASAAPAVPKISRAARGRRKTKRDQLLAQLEQLSEGVPTPEINEPLRTFFVRTKAFWEEQAVEISKEVGKELRRDAFGLCQQRFVAVRPILDNLEEMDRKEKEEQEADRQLAERRAQKAKEAEAAKKPQPKPRR